MPDHKSIAGYEPIPGFEKRYLISKKGNVMSSLNNKILKSIFDTCGYKKISLFIKGKSRQIFIHILVAKTYLKNTNSKKKYIDHIDGKKTNNHVSNLRYVTASENGKNAHRNNKNMQNARKPIIRIDTDGNIKIYNSATIAAKENNINRENISSCCNNRRKICGGYKWEFLTDPANAKKIELQPDEIFIKLDEINGIQYGNYEISNYGKVKNIAIGNFVSAITYSSYDSITLWTKNTRKTYYIHRLVAYFFVERKNNKNYVVNHIDENKKNNHYKNLQWITHRQNTIFSVGKRICKIDKKSGEILDTYDSASSAARELGKKNSSCISGCCSVRYKSAYGFKWKFLQDILDTMINDGFVEITKDKLKNYDPNSTISYISNKKLKYGRKFIKLTRKYLIYEHNDQKRHVALSNVEKIWILD